jgi:hypothetical protein
MSIDPARRGHHEGLGSQGLAASCGCSATELKQRAGETAHPRAKIGQRTFLRR